jgi:signal transduction histidine kinase/ActR/RegA family two-component response regulator
MNPFRSIRVKLLAVVTLTAFCALLVSGSAIFLYEISSFRTSRISDMAAQIDLLSYSATPALQFLDENMARENLNLLRTRPGVRMAAIYDAQGKVFASYVRRDQAADLPAAPSTHGTVVSDESIEISAPIVLDNTVIGTAFMRADFPLRERVVSFFIIQLGVAVGALVVSVAVTIWLQTRITQPILSIAEVARQTVQRKDFTKRAAKTSDDEVGVLVDAFNDMLQEIAARTTVLESTNRELEHEISERKRARVEVLYLNSQLEKRIQELTDKDRNKDEFLATLAHELRNPLAPIRSGLEVLRRADDSKREKIYSIIERQTNHLIRLVDDLMEVSRISRGKVTLKKQVVSLQEVLQVAIEATSELMQQKNHAFVARIPETPVWLNGDPVRLSQVFLNLLSNAAHYTNEGGAITLEATCHEDLLEVSIQDNGIGMAPDVLEKVFGAFVQLDSPLGRTRAGLGIGLTLARALIRMHDGTIRAESEGSGKGSRFVVLLPLQAIDAAPTRAPSAEVHGDERRHRILVVDDNEDAALVLSMQLRLAGHELRVAYSGSEALETGREFQPDTIIMDIGMPGMNGFDTAREVRRQAWGAKVLLIAVTGWGQPEDKRQSREAGFDHHLLKPVRAADIESLLGAPDKPEV